MKNGNISKWKILKIPKELVNQKDIQFVIAPKNLEKIREFIEIIGKKIVKDKL